MSKFKIITTREVVTEYIVEATTEQEAKNNFENQKGYYISKYVIDVSSEIINGISKEVE